MRTELLGNLISISKGRKHDLSVAGKRYIQIEDLRHCENIKYTAATSGTEVKCSDLVIVWDGAYSGLVSYGLEGLIGSTLARLRPVDGYDVYTPYLGHLLKTKFDYLQSQCTGATIPHVSKHSLVSIEVPLPPLPEQKRIAAILHQADEIRRKREKAIELTDSFLRSVFLEMFGDPASNPQALAVAPLSDLIRIKRDSIQPCDIREGTRYLGLEHIESGGRIIDTPAVMSGELSSNKFRFDSHDILFGKLRPYLCKVAAPDFAGICSTDILPLVPKSAVFKNYLLSYLRTPSIVRLAAERSAGANLPRLSPKVLASFSVPIPTESALVAYNKVFDRLMKLRTQLQAAAYHSTSLTRALSQYLFSETSNQENCCLEVQGLSHAL